MVRVKIRNQFLGAAHKLLNGKISHYLNLIINNSKMLRKNESGSFDCNQDLYTLSQH